MTDVAESARVEESTDVTDMVRLDRHSPESIEIQNAESKDDTKIENNNEESKSETELIVTLCESPHRWVELNRYVYLNAFNSAQSAGDSR